VHLITGLALLAGALALDQSGLTLQVIGTAYAVVAILGFLGGDMLLGFIQMNTAGRWLHVVLAAIPVPVPVTSSSSPPSTAGRQVYQKAGNKARTLVG
jgi:hypothetical protein